jgi:catechol 2,3-dioxygenase-like lactoylglutathione lyase family enzyme
MSGKPRIRALNHVGLTVASMDASLAFYTGIFDVTVHGPWQHDGPGVGMVTGYPGCGTTQAFLDFGVPGQLIELIEYQRGGVPIDAANGNAGAVHFCIVVDDVEALFTDLSARGHRFVSRPFSTPDNPHFCGKLVYLIDPDGIRIELFEPRLPG